MQYKKMERKAGAVAIHSRIERVQKGHERPDFDDCPWEPLPLGTVEPELFVFVLSPFLLSSACCFNC